MTVHAGKIFVYNYGKKCTYACHGHKCHDILWGVLFLFVGFARVE